jgi:hypothetical protein
MDGRGEGRSVSPGRFVHLPFSQLRRSRYPSGLVPDLVDGDNVDRKSVMTYVVSLFKALRAGSESFCQSFPSSSSSSLSTCSTSTIPADPGVGRGVDAQAPSPVDEARKFCLLLFISWRRGFCTADAVASARGKRPEGGESRESSHPVAETEG